MDEKKKESEITVYLHCKKCLLELPKNKSPQSWGKNEIGITRNRDIEVWCRRHEEIVTTLSTLKNLGYVS